MNSSHRSVAGALISVATLLLVLAPLGSACAQTQWSGREGWVEEPATKSLNVKSDVEHSYLDPASVHRGDDGLVYFSESTGVTKPEDIGHTGFMKDAYDCGKNLKYMCVGIGDWRNDLKSTIKTADDPALQVYRKYLCGDGADAGSSNSNPSAKTADSEQHR
jgi:hypothetical protein